MSTTDEQVFLNGRIVPEAEARISVFDAGFAHGAGLFETMRAYRGRVMRLADHVDRLMRSAVALEMQVSLPPDVLERGVYDVLAANNLKNARLRLTVTPGNVPRPGRSPTEAQQPTVLIAASEVNPHPPELYRHGMRVCISPYRQTRYNPVAGHKTLGYLPRLLAMKEAADRRCHEALWFNTENQLAEGSICNVFTVRAGVVVTPPLDTPVLPGTVRKAVIELAKAGGMPVEERPIVIDDLLVATEVFLTGSVLEIMPVTSIEKHEVGDGKPGEVTRRLRELYVELVAKECGPE